MAPGHHDRGDDADDDDHQRDDAEREKHFESLQIPARGIVIRGAVA